MAFETSDKKLTSLTLNKVTRRQYKAISDAGMVDGDQFYLVTDVGVDAVGLPVRNVGTPVLATDAANLKYVKDWVDNIESSLIGNVVYSGHITINDVTAYEGLEKKTLREIFRGYLAANGVQDVVYTQVPEGAEFDPSKTYYVKAGSEYVEAVISAFDPGSIYYTREDGLLDKYELKNGQSFQLTVDMSGYTQTSVTSGDFSPETTEYFVRDENGAFIPVPSTAEFDPDERYYVAVGHQPTFVTADGILLSDRDYIIINNHSAIHGESENVVQVANISRETVDIVDIGSDTLVKKAEYDEFKDETERKTAALETEVNALDANLAAAKTELIESIAIVANTAAANLKTHTTNGDIHVTAENKAFWSAKTDAMISTTWSDLKAKRDSAKLVPGQEYRITDYVATTNGDMSSQSANHPFDIIVTADATNKLNEVARAIRHAADAYFPNATKFEAWQVWYSIDNDTSRFAWADNTTNGKGVVYRLVDEFGNDVPYDFKGLQFKAYDDSDNVYRYTFDSGDDSDNTDLSLAGWSNDVFGNRIGAYVTGGMQELNRIVFKGGFCHSNTFGNDCYSNTFGNDCLSNTFGKGCHSNFFGNGNSFNTFGGYCHSNTFWDRCSSNTFGDFCASNTFGNYCESNTFGVECSSNTFGNYCSSNTFRNRCYGNTFGSYCSSNTFGDRCERNSFGTSSSVKSHCRYITVQSGNRYLYINPTGTTSSSAFYQNVEIKSGVNNTESFRTINDPNVGQSFHTTYKPANSQEISV